MNSLVGRHIYIGWNVVQYPIWWGTVPGVYTQRASIALFPSLSPPLFLLYDHLFYLLALWSRCHRRTRCMGGWKEEKSVHCGISWLGSYAYFSLILYHLRYRRGSGLQPFSSTFSLLVSTIYAHWSTIIESMVSVYSSPFPLSI